MNFGCEDQNFMNKENNLKLEKDKWGIVGSALFRFLR